MNKTNKKTIKFKTMRYIKRGSIILILLLLSISISSAATSQSPYSGTPRSIPGTIQAENFDKGGEGIAYHDLDSVNQGGQYRPTEGVDLESTTDTGAGYNVGWIKSGEWIEYTTTVSTSGTYTIETRVSSNGNGGTFHIEFNGLDKTGPMTIPNTGGWQNWQTLSKTVTLNSGQQVMKIVMDTGGATRYVGNLNYIRISSSTSTPSPTPAPTLTPTSTPAPTATPTSPSSSTVPSGYNLVWSDEFNGASVDTNKWTVINDGSLDGNLPTTAARRASHITETGGNLVITGSMDGGYPITGMMYTRSYQFKYGYIEYRVKFPLGDGSSGQMWAGAVNSNGVDSVNWESEVSKDTYTVDNRYTNDISTTISGGSATSGGIAYHIEHTPDAWKDFHIYSSEWTPTYVSYKIDGVEKYRETSSTYISNSNLNIFIQNLLGTNGVSWAKPLDISQLPSVFYVDYVRVYQK